MKFLFRPYIRYKFLNALFSGIVGGSVFTIYASLAPITFSIGGLILAFGMMGIAYVYHHLMKLKYFYLFTLITELIMLGMVSYFLLFSDHHLTALIVYASYQLSFILGGYLARAETHFAKKARMMGWFDIAKQQGYIGGLAFSYLFYKILEHYQIIDNTLQVYYLHWVLILIQTIVLLALWRSFTHRKLFP